MRANIFVWQDATGHDPERLILVIRPKGVINAKSQNSAARRCHDRSLHRPNLFSRRLRIAICCTATAPYANVDSRSRRHSRDRCRGLGALVALRGWAKHSNRRLKLMNVTPRVEQLLHLTKLDRSFEVCSAEEMLDLLCRAIHKDESSKARFEVANAVESRPDVGTALCAYANSSAA